MTRRTSFIVAVLALASACGGSEKEPGRAPTPSKKTSDGIEIRVVNSGPQGASSASASTREIDDPDRYGLRVAIQATRPEAEIGSSIPLEVSVRNIGQETALLFDLERGFREACTILVKPPEGKTLRFGIQRNGGGPTSLRDFYEIRPGETRRATVDVAPVLAQMDSSAPGDYAISLVFTSPFAGERFGVRAWNELGYKEVVSNAVTVRLTWPDWKGTRGVTPAVEKDVLSILDAVGPDGAMDPLYRDLLLDLGTPALAALEEKIGLCADVRFDKSLQGWNALYALVSVRDVAVPYLAASPRAARPVNVFLLDLIAEVESPGEDSTVAPLLEALRDGRGKDSPFSARLIRNVPEGDPQTLTVRPDGKVVLVEPADGKLRSRTADLGAEGVLPLFVSLHENLFWIQRPLRPSGSAQESLLRFQFLQGERPLHEAAIWETEAVAGNRHVGRILQTFRDVEKAARAEIAKRGK